MPQPASEPQHVAIIMDGNGRWAKERNMIRQMGHKEGVEALRRTINACLDFQIPYLSVYVFSTENWNRPKIEINFLMRLMGTLIKKEISNFIKNKVRIRCLGNLDPLPENLKKSMAEVQEKTKDFSTLNVNLMVNYGARIEMLRAVKSIVDSGTPSDQVTLDTISEHLYTTTMPDPDILIRTGGEYRLSNFMLWQNAYTELFFIDEYWPAFTKDHLQKVLDSYKNRDRRYGGL